MKEYTNFAIAAGVVVAVFAVLWFTGNLVKLRNYVLETREELRKCTWPTVDELRGHTIVVIISVLLLGFFTIAIDRILYWCVTSMVRF
jgi:preprotein translocase subunit SecE